MGKRIAVILGHPDADPARFGRALATAYVRGAEEAGHEVRMIAVAALDFPLLRPGFAFTKAGPGRPWKTLLKGRSARLVVTMGMPAIFYRLFFQAHSVASLRRNVLGFCGIAPVRTTYIGMVEGTKDAKRKDWLGEMATLGRSAR